MGDLDLPYTVEYAKSGRASCKVCKLGINKDQLRMGIMIQAPKFDGRIPLWHHVPCFFKKKKLLTTGDVDHFDSLRWEDQKLIKDHMSSVGNGVAESGPSGGKGKKKAKAKSAPVDLSNAEFSIQYATSSRSSCKYCELKIQKAEVRVSKMDHDSETARRFGPSLGWHHLNCFVTAREDLGFTESGEKLPGFSGLSEEDQAIVKEKLKGIEAKKRKAEPEEKPAKKPKLDSKEEKALEAQSKFVYSFRDKLRDFGKKEMIELLEFNSQEPPQPAGQSDLLDVVSDGLAFGALKPCPECSGQLKFGTNEYKCSGYVTGWTKCQYVTKKPDRKAFSVPDDFKEAYPFLKKYKYVPRDKLISSNLAAPSQTSSKTSTKPLAKFKIAIIGNLVRERSEVEAIITNAGGTLLKKVDKNTTCVITTKDESQKNLKNFKIAEKHGVYVVSEEFLDDLSTLSENTYVSKFMKKHAIYSWGKEPEETIPIKSGKSEASSSSSSVSGAQTVTMTVEGKAAVDPASGLQYSHIVVEKRGDVFNAVLGKVDVIKGTNAYYKIQLLKNKVTKRFVVFRAWGRVGTTIGDKKTTKFDTFEEAMDDFVQVYLEQTGNEWCDRDNFVKKPRCYYPLDIDYGQDQSQKMTSLKPGSNSKLPKSIQELICMIFDVEAMKKAMLEFEIDLKKMPLGKLSKKQIKSAYLVLTEVQTLLKGDKNATKILDASNRFYTLIPHDFGLKKPPLLDNEFLLESKTKMLESLMEIECAYNMLQENLGTEEDPVDQHYKQLKTDIELLDKKTDEFKRIKLYITNTHATTHNQYKLELQDVFKITRYGESEKYQKYKDLHNKQLLWHGSRTTNYAGILSQGLRIAPPEAPVTGYMFGKGIYFADMVSKSANYCFTNQKNPIGLLLLCEVALGNMYERTQADFIEKLPKDKHSTKGLGQTQPNPKENIVENDISIPLGKPVKSTDSHCNLLYNEFIVYDVNQVNIKYLLKVKFNWRF